MASKQCPEMLYHSHTQTDALRHIQTHTHSYYAGSRAVSFQGLDSLPSPGDTEKNNVLLNAIVSPCTNTHLHDHTPAIPTNELLCSFSPLFVHLKCVLIN